MNGKLSRISKTAASGVTRSEGTAGQFFEYPEIGKTFKMVSDLNFDGSKGNRFWSTSVVSLLDVSKDADKKIRFHTKSGSMYELEVLE